MNKQRQETRELLNLQIKLARLKIAASYLKQQKLQEKKREQEQVSVILYRLLDIGSDWVTGNWLQPDRLFRQGKSRWGMLAAVLAVKVWQQLSVQTNTPVHKPHSD